MAKKIKVFDGKRYWLYQTYGSRVHAEDKARELREKGFFTRVVSLFNYEYEIYCRKRGNNNR